MDIYTYVHMYGIRTYTIHTVRTYVCMVPSVVKWYFSLFMFMIFIYVRTKQFHYLATHNINIQLKYTVLYRYYCMYTNIIFYIHYMDVHLYNVDFYYI